MGVIILSNNHFEINNMDRLNIGDHSVLLYEHEKDTILPLVSFIKSSLKRGEKCLYIKGDTNTELLKNKLENEVENFKKYINTKQLQFLTKEETYSLSDNFKADRMINKIKRISSEAKNEGYTGLSITGELSWVLNFENGDKELIKYEVKLNDEIFDNYPVIALCRYNIHKFDKKIIRSIIELHEYIIWEKKLQENPYYIEPAGFIENKKVEYEIKTWLKNINEYKKKKSKLQKQIKEKRNEYEFLFNQISDAVYLHELDSNNEFGKFLKVNKQATEMLGYSKEELLDMKPTDIATNDIIEHYHHELLNNISQQKNIMYESKHITKYGRIIPVEINMNYYTQDGKSYLLSIVRDITERKEDEKKLLEAKNSLQEKNEMLEANNEEIRAMNEELESSYQELDRLTNNLENIIELISKIDVDMSVKDFLSVVLRKAIDIISAADHGMIYLKSDGQIEIVNSVGYDLDLLKEIEIKSSYLKSQREFYIKECKNYKMLDKKKTQAKTYNRFYNLLKNTKNTMLINLYRNKEEIGRISLGINAKSDAKFDNTSKRLLGSLERLTSSYLTLKRYNILQQEFTNEVINSFTNLLEIYDYYTKGHNENVAKISLKIARKMDLSKDQRKKIYWAGLLHDIGKIIIPQHILNKKGKLTKKEYEIIKNHAKWGYQTLKKSEELSEIAEYILYHHERWDGTGYPEGLAGDAIPKISQILAVADAWDAMTSKRSYRDSLEISEALAELQNNSGTQFSPEIVKAFLETKKTTFRENSLLNKKHNFSINL